MPKTGIGDRKVRRIFSRAKRVLLREKIPGASLGVLYRGKEYYASFGVTSFDNPLPVTPDTLFKIASVSKTFLALAVVRLVEQGVLGLDIPVKKYLPGFRMKDRRAQETVTLRHLLTHTAGWFGDYFNDFGRGDDALAKLVGKLAEVPQVSAPGEIFSYSNTCFNVAGRVLEVVTGKPYETVIKESVLEPLALNDSVFFAEEVLLRRFAMGHTRKDDRIVTAKPWARSRSASPTGGLLCNARDLLRYARFQMGNGCTPEGKRLLSAKSMMLMHDPVREAFGGRRIALSWFVYDAGGHQVLWHGGGTIGQLCELHIVPSARLAVVVLTNTDHTSALSSGVAKLAMKEFLDYEAPTPKPLCAARSALCEYVGEYSNPDTKWQIKFSGSGLKLFRTNTGGFPTPKDKPKVQPKPVRVAVCEDDKLLFLEGPSKGVAVDFIRDSRGRVAWVSNSRAMKRRRS